MFQYNNITSIDLTHNPALRELYCHSSHMTKLDLSTNTALTLLRCYSNDIATLDLSHNPLISDVGTSGLSSELAKLTVRYSPGTMPYHTDMRDYTGNDYTAITSVKGYTSTGYEIQTSFASDGTASFLALPVKVIYTYSTGYTGSADIDASLKVSLIPDPENFFSPLVSREVVTSSIVSRETVTVVSREVVVSHEVEYVSTGSSGGCNNVFTPIIIAVFAAFIFSKR